MVKGMNFKNIHIICGNHGDDHSIEMQMREGAVGMSAFYSCPKYISNLRPEEGRSCYNRLDTTSFMKMVDILSEEKMSDDGQIFPLKGFKFKIKRIEFTVLDEKEDGELWVMVMNHKPITV